MTFIVAKEYIFPPNNSALDTTLTAMNRPNSDSTASAIFIMRGGAVIERQPGQINVHRQAGHIADKQINGRAALKGKRLLFRHMGQDL